MADLDDSFLEVHAVEDGTPPAIVILFGWLGSQSRHLRKYAQLYRERKCSTIHGMGDTASVMFRRNENLKKLGMDAAKEAIKLLKASEDKTIPVIIHVFSGGGCVVLEQLELLLMEARDAKEPKTGNQEDLMTLYDAIQRGGQVFDSSPAYLGVGAGIQAIAAGVPNRTVQLIIQFMFVVFSVITMIICKLTEQKPGAELHWQHMLDSDIAKRQGYIYSTSDRLTDYEKVQEVIEYRKKRPESKVTVKRFTKSKHCQHLMAHPQEYNAFLDEFLASIKEQKTEQKLLEEDPDMTDYQLGMD
ncbi:transmembrane protein 53 [Seminavis robusta]|uniref:Transmembrane protein 53 n=1 Tax=Seminavis robusta TaxID=568900 RepID=A0A9N8F0B4_9STRA|nr:transmembrane protein 53 [Seminavis robusta]|eukprot:Sro2340_g324050.1 transmembrane protein 53 (301) ;mRNA; f:14013-15026